MGWGDDEDRKAWPGLQGIIGTEATKAGGTFCKNIITMMAIYKKAKYLSLRTMHLCDNCVYY